MARCLRDRGYAEQAGFRWSDPDRFPFALEFAARFTDEQILQTRHLGPVKLREFRAVYGAPRHERNRPVTHDTCPYIPR